MTFTDTQLILLSAAAQRDDGLLPRPAKGGGAVLRTLEAALVKAGAVEPLMVRADQPSWRADATEAPIGLRITAVGLAALGIEPAASTDYNPRIAACDDQAQPGEVPLLPAAPLRAGTKRALLIELLSSAEGASIVALGAALAWQPHTIRAALTRLRQSGFTVIVTRDAGKPTLYRIGASDQETASADATHDGGEVAR